MTVRCADCGHRLTSSPCLNRAHRIAAGMTPGEAVPFGFRECANGLGCLHRVRNVVVPCQPVARFRAGAITCKTCEFRSKVMGNVKRVGRKMHDTADAEAFWTDQASRH